MGIIKSSNKGMLSSNGLPKARKITSRKKQEGLNDSENIKGLSKGGKVKK